MTLLDLLTLMRKHLKIVIIIPLMCALVTAVFCWLVLPDTYTSKVSMYVLTKSSQDENALTNTDLTASQMLTNDTATLIKSSRVMDDAARSLNMDSLNGYQVSVTSETTTRVITVSVTGTSADTVAAVANQIAKTTDQVAQNLMELKSVNVIDQATVAASPSGPPRAMYTAAAFLVGIILSLVVLVLMDTLDTRVRNPEEVEEMLGIPIIGRIPAARG